METVQQLAEIGSQVADIARTQGEIAATKAVTGKMKEISPKQKQVAEAEWRKANPGREPTQADITGQVYQTLYNRAMLDSKMGTGGPVQQGIQAATAAVQGLAAGNMAQALTGAAAPYLAEIIHQQTITYGPDGKEVVNVEANLIAHAVVGAVTAYAAGNPALAGASGAAMGEFIAQQMYPGVERSKLSEEQRQTISALGTLAAGLAGGVAGDSTGSAQAGKNALENNNLAVLGQGVRLVAQGCTKVAACRNVLIKEGLEICLELVPQSPCLICFQILIKSMYWALPQRAVPI
ncbi:Pre-toxin domain with VENN motif protein (plasmid) [Duffyella gerundensis]|uniref:VENN motif pre-toxin domain-containing protein n=1 Tax=Duffyella gerundensis TaxID=1619313 RepID=UPI001CE3AB46|nr:VENN motif pre-toxin domain-containing protein [Duffyella gerundensis]UCB33328.1 Pre-toxin domain with VENN motif protein [Duffyella gerundensis]